LKFNSVATSLQTGIVQRYVLGAVFGIILLIIINIFLLIQGCFMSATAGLIIVTPMLLAVASKIGMDPIHLGVVIVLNLMIGLVTPPVGTVLYTLTRVTGIPLERLSYAMLPWYIPLAATLCISTSL
jgi:TRAP-type C4-dicarboxylate transport system permease large subunit